MRGLLIDVAIGFALTAVVLMPWWVPRLLLLYHDWVDARRVRKVLERRATFHAVKFPAEDEERRREAQRWN